MGAVQVFASFGDISKDLSGNGKHGNVPMEVLDDTGGSHNQAAQGKVTEFNGTVVPALATTVNPNLGFVYEL